MGTTPKKPTKNNPIQDLIEQMNDKHGDGAIASGVPIEYDLIPSGSFTMDHLILGIGGYAKGRIYEYLGWEGVGKSTLAGHAIAECQAQGGVAAYIDGENAVDRQYFESLGVDFNEERLLFSQPSCGEEGFDIALNVINSGLVSLVVIDSDSSLLPKKQIEGVIGASNMGLKAKLNGDIYPRMRYAVRSNNVCVIVISQYREKIGVMFGDPRTTQGGHALKFYADCRLEMAKSQSKEGTQVIGNIIRTQAIKNKMFPPFLKHEFEILFGLGINKTKEIVDLIKKFKLGKKYMQTFTFNGTKYPLDEFNEMVAKDTPLRAEAIKLVLEAIHNEEGSADADAKKAIDKKVSKSSEDTETKSSIKGGGM